MAKPFTAQLRNITDRQKRNMRYIATEAIQDVMEAAQTPQVGVTAKHFQGPWMEGRVPVVEGDLIKSLKSGIGSASSEAGSTSYVTAIADYDLGDRLEFEWTMEYALRIEAGFNGTDSLGREYKQPGRHYVGKNAQRFSEFVKKRAAEVK
jgi:hypothetical protein